MKLSMFKKYLFGMVLLMLSLAGNAQGELIRGRVADSSGKPIASATVLLKGTKKGSTTDQNGNFSIEASRGATLVFSAIGYDAKEWLAGTSSSEIVLKQNALGILQSEVIVVAYGTKKKSDLTSSVVSVSSKDFQKGAVSSSEQLLVGKVAGLEVTNGGGSAGGGSKIRIRGSSSLNASNDPLIVIDGLPVEGNGISGNGNLLNTINPNDIESISVLKDASATAMYGSRATNGVIIVTTKRGTAKKPQFTFSTKYAYNQVGKKIDVLNGNQVRQIVQESKRTEFIALLGTENTDWQDEIYQNASTAENNLSVAGRWEIGGSINLPYRFSGGVLNQEGNLKTNNFNRYTASMGLSPKFFDNYLSVNINFKYSKTRARDADEGAIGGAVGYNPTVPVYTDKDKYGGFYEIEQGGSFPLRAPKNPMALLMLREQWNTTHRIISNIQLDYKLHFFPDLHIMANFGIDKINGSYDGKLDPRSASSLLYNVDSNKVSRGYWNFGEQVKKNKLADIQLYYEKSLGSGNKIDILVGHGWQEFFTDQVFNQDRFFDGELNYRNPLNFPDDRNGFAIESYIGRINATISDYFLLSGSMRRDASSKFSPKNRVGYFPSASFAWKLKDHFFSKSSKLTDLKLRFGWGETGQQDGIANYSYLPVYSATNYSANYQIGDAFYPALRPRAFDPNVKWETTQTLNIGLDYGFAKGRINGTFDVYQKKTIDLLSVVPIPLGANFDVELLRNVGNMLNEGVEASISFTPVKTSKLVWDVSLNGAVNRSKITKLLEYEDPNFKGLSVSRIGGAEGLTIGKYAVGKAPFVFFPHRQVYDENGKPVDGLYEDINKDGVVSENDRYYYKKPAADFLFGASTNVTIGKFSVGLAGHGQIGNYLYNNFLSIRTYDQALFNPGVFVQNASTEFLNTRFSNGRFYSDFYMENASFFRIDNLNFGYNVGKVWKEKVSLRLSASMQNVAVFTKYKGVDPEISHPGGVDNTIYPRPRIFSISADINF